MTAGEQQTVACNGADVVPEELHWRRGEVIVVTVTVLDWAGWES